MFPWQDLMREKEGWAMWMDTNMWMETWAMEWGDGMDIVQDTDEAWGMSVLSQGVDVEWQVQMHSRCKATAMAPVGTVPAAIAMTMVMMA